MAPAPTTAMRLSIPVSSDPALRQVEQQSDLDAKIGSRRGSPSGAIYLTSLWGLRHPHRVAGDGAEVFAHVVVARLVRLDAADLVGGPRHQHVTPPLPRVPAVGPAHPHKPLARRLDVGGVPNLAAVCADLDLGDRAGPAPGVAADHVDPGR